jgi:hypothetical protein
MTSSAANTARCPLDYAHDSVGYGLDRQRRHHLPSLRCRQRPSDPAVVEAVYVGSYVEAIASDDPFDSVEAFMRRFDSYTSGSSLTW